jgi:LmbE family N-acetylglucosaminyl deacetylase
MNEPANKCCVALMAHPDDAEILCAGTLARLAELGWKIHIASMTAGDCGTTELPAAEISSVRKNEAQKSAALIGGQYHCLEELDGFVCYDQPTLRKVVDLFRTLTPALVLTHAQQDYMMDHEQTCLLARGASFLFAAPNASKLPLSPNARVPHLYFADPIEGLDHAGQITKPTTVIRVDATMGRKLEMLACHESQMKWLRAHNQSGDPFAMVRKLAEIRGGLIGARHGEGFVQFRAHGHPADDLLATLLPA